jgi:hypothetical protein
VVSFTPHPLYTWERILYRRLGGPQSRSGRNGKVKILESTGTRTPTSRSSSPLPVAISNALSRPTRDQINVKIHLSVCKRNTSFPESPTVEITCFISVAFIFPATVTTICHDLKSSSNFKIYRLHKDRLCGLVVRVTGYRSRGSGFDSRRYQIF